MDSDKSAIKGKKNNTITTNHNLRYNQQTVTAESISGDTYTVQSTNAYLLFSCCETKW